MHEPQVGLITWTCPWETGLHKEEGREKIALLTPSGEVLNLGQEVKNRVKNPLIHQVKDCRTSQEVRPLFCLFKNNVQILLRYSYSDDCEKTSIHILDVKLNFYLFI